MLKRWALLDVCPLEDADSTVVQLAINTGTVICYCVIYKYRSITFICQKSEMGFMQLESRCILVIYAALHNVFFSDDLVLFSCI